MSAMLKLLHKYMNQNYKLLDEEMAADAQLCWYHGNLSREEAERVLQNDLNAHSGLFLVRNSSSSARDFVLSVLSDQEVIHYQIRRHGEDAFFSIDENPIVHGLETLIEYYQDPANDLGLTDPVINDPPPHDTRRHGRTNLLHRATKNGNFTVVSELLKCGYRSLEAKDETGQTAVHLASILGEDVILEKLIESGATVNCRDQAGNTPLHYACQRNKSSTVRVLIKGGANVQIRNTSTGWVPLHEAACLGHKEIVEYLLFVGAPSRPRTIANETPQHLAEEHGYFQIADLLKNSNPPPFRYGKEDWYHGTLSRNEAINILMAFGNYEGQFLVRYSDKERTHVLTMICSKKPYHFPIKQIHDYFVIDDGPYLDSLEHVVEHYSNMSDGLPTTLQHPIKPKPKPPVPHFLPSQSTANLTLPSKNKKKQGWMVNNFTTLPPKPKPRHSVDSAIDFRTSMNSLLDGPFNRSMQSLPFSLPPEARTQMNPGPVQNRTRFEGGLTREGMRTVHNSSQSIHRPYSSSSSESSHSLTNPSHSLMEFQKPPRIRFFIPKDNLIMNNVLGEGEFGAVYRALYQTGEGNEIEVAVKTLHRERMNTKNRNEFIKEAELMMGLNHHCIVKLIGLSQNDDNLLMVQELVPLGSLLQFLLQHPSQASPEYELPLWASQIALGMEYLDKNKFVHRDLAARNILLATRHQAKISDFGLSRVTNDKDYYRATNGGRWPIKWYAPESYNYGQFSSASDVWSFGVTLWEMFSYGAQPYCELKGVDVIALIDRGERLPKPDACTEEIYQMMEKCWHHQPRDRPRFPELAEFFANLNNYVNVRSLITTTDIS